VDQVDKISDSILFHEGDLKKGHCNNAWVVFEDYVLVVDANFPSGALAVLPKIRASTDKPIRYVFDTHHHGDHAYGNQVWIENGATPVGHTGVVEEMKRVETGLFGGKPGRWEGIAEQRQDVRASRLRPPTLLFSKELAFDDGKRRVELLHLGIGHTSGDAVAWLPNERILMMGDLCVNGPYNFVGDGDIEKWIRTLDAARKLGPNVVIPGHGPRGTADLLEEQRTYFVQLRSVVGRMVQQGATPEQLKAGTEAVSAELNRNSRIKKFVGSMLQGQIAKVYNELTGMKLDTGTEDEGAAG
jgi:glyoxylase-like metal-dependent hydrolase (beta-lactamase superfamily II)